MRKLTSEQKREIAAIAAKSDEDIDFSEMRGQEAVKKLSFRARGGTPV